MYVPRKGRNGAHRESENDFSPSKQKGGEREREREREKENKHTGLIIAPLYDHLSKHSVRRAGPTSSRY